MSINIREAKQGPAVHDNGEISRASLRTKLTDIFDSQCIITPSMKLNPRLRIKNVNWDELTISEAIIENIYTLNY